MRRVPTLSFALRQQRLTAPGFVRLRSYLGYPPVRDAQQNTTHFALAALQYSSVVNKLVTQNVDGLHHKAIAHAWGEDRMQERMLELHGRLRVGMPYRGLRIRKSQTAHTECTMRAWASRGQRCLPDPAFRGKSALEGFHGRARSYWQETTDES